MDGESAGDTPSPASQPDSEAYRPTRIGPPGPEHDGDQGKRRRASRGAGRGDRILGIVIGILLGIGIITAFVFLGSEETIDAPRISDESSGVTGEESPAGPGAGSGEEQ